MTRPTLKSDAEGAVKNQIEVLPLSPMDGQIRRAGYRAIYGDPMLSTRYGYRALPSIHILVKNGHVLLEGWVANKADYEMVYMRASGVAGMRGVGGMHGMGGMRGMGATAGPSRQRLCAESPSRPAILGPEAHRQRGFRVALSRPRAP